MQKGDVGVEPAVRVAVGVARRGRTPAGLWRRREAGWRPDALLALGSLWAVAAGRIHHPCARRICLLRRMSCLCLLGVEPVPPVGGESLPALNLCLPVGLRHAQWFCQRRPRLPLLHLGGVDTGSGARGRVLLRRHGGRMEGRGRRMARERRMKGNGGGKRGIGGKKGRLSPTERTHTPFRFGRRLQATPGGLGSA